MPTYGGYQFGPWEADPRRWARCRVKARADLIAGGWDRLSKKLDDAVRKRAERLFHAKAVA